MLLIITQIHKYSYLSIIFHNRGTGPRAGCYPDPLGSEIEAKPHFFFSASNQSDSVLTKTEWDNLDDQIGGCINLDTPPNPPKIIF